jgi:hypothetical protein
VTSSTLVLMRSGLDSSSSVLAQGFLTLQTALIVSSCRIHASLGGALATNLRSALSRCSTTPLFVPTPLVARNVWPWSLSMPLLRSR